MRARECALRLLLEYEASGKYANLSLSSHVLDSVPADERGFVTSLFYTAVEHKLTYDYYIAAFAKRSADKLSEHTKNVLRLGICQLVDMKNIPDFAAVNETVKLSKNPGERAFVNGVLRAVSSAEELPLPPREKNAARYLSVKYSVPVPTVKHFISMLGEDGTEALLKKFNETAPLTLTVNTLKISVEDFIKKLGSKIVTLHVSDYDFRNERHWLPYEGKNNWVDIVTLLEEAGYCGPFMYEISPKTPDSIIRGRDLEFSDFVENYKACVEKRPIAPLGTPNEKACANNSYFKEPVIKY